FVTHDQDEAFEMSDRVVLMNGGQIEQIGSPEALYDSPQTRFAASFIGEASLTPCRIAEVHGDEVVAAVGDDFRIKARAVRPTHGVGSEALLMTRPERVTLSDPGAPSALPVTISKRVFQGERILFELETASGNGFQCSVPSIEKHRAMRPGQRVGAMLQECRVIPGV
ncbi:TOBE domain-containing protein, partial [Rhizobiaceae sp. 2RAB30]